MAPLAPWPRIELAGIWSPVPRKSRAIRWIADLNLKTPSRKQVFESFVHAALAP